MATALPELDSVPWRRRVDELSLRRVERLWTLITAGHTCSFAAAAGLLAALQPLTFPLGLILLAHAWAISELYAARGARATGRQQAPRRAPGPEGRFGVVAERAALGLLGDLVGHKPRELHRESGLMLEHGRFGVWLVGEAGAVLVRPGGRRVDCYCVRVPEPGIPPSDRIAHLLLALREDESGFATVANLSFSGAPWRLRRRLGVDERLALKEAVGAARGR